MSSLGHLVLYVRDLQASSEFYRDLVGLHEVGRLLGGKARVFSGGGTHHELMLIQVGDAPGPLQGRRIGLYHSGWRVGADAQALRQAMQRVTQQGYAVEALVDHLATWSLYLHDPDGNAVELYVDNPEFDWRNDKSWLDSPGRPLRLDELG